LLRIVASIGTNNRAVYRRVLELADAAEFKRSATDALVGIAAGTGPTAWQE